MNAIDMMQTELSTIKFCVDSKRFGLLLIFVCFSCMEKTLPLKKN